jgi:hypothetical protein
MRPRLLVTATATLCVALVALVACGGGSGRPARARAACSRAVADAIGPGTRAALRSRTLDLVTCVYHAPTPRGTVVRVTVDTAPQAQFRFVRWDVERRQAFVAAPPAQRPRILPGIGDGAAWVPAERELRATAKGRLVTVVVARAAPGTSARATALAPARAVLGLRARRQRRPVSG